MQPEISTQYPHNGTVDNFSFKILGISFDEIKKDTSILLFSINFIFFKFRDLYLSVQVTLRNSQKICIISYATCNITSIR